MKHLKILGVVAVCATALMAFAGTASATTLTSPAGTTYSGSIKSTSEGIVKLKATFGTIECESSVEGKVETNPGTPVSGKVSKLTWTNCGPGSCSATTLKTGSLSIESSGGGNGTLTGNGQEVETNCFGLNCVWTTSNTSLGTVTGSSNTKATATLDISATIPRSGGTGGGFCGSTGTWSGSYIVNTPDELFID
jgi:hypothetical protein